jgi:bacillithiol biosynthesis deacetylase BshB1
MTTNGCDLLCICPHPDDAEIALGGTLRLLADRGRRVWVCDLTRGELATNASPEERWQEAERASAVLGLTGRVQLALPDGFLAADDREQVTAVVSVLRRLRPRWVLTAPEAIRHPDHVALPPLVQKAVFLARLRNLAPPAPAARWWGASPEEAAETWVPEALGETCPRGEGPDLYFDVSTVWQAKLAALDCYASQLRRDGERRPTAINDPEFLAWIDDRARHWGRAAGCERAEAVRLRARPVLQDLPAERWA